MKRIATVAEIPRDGFKFTYQEGPFEEEGILFVGPTGIVTAFKNECRHLPMRLDERQPAEIFDEGSGHVICSSHGAVFRTEDGLCMKGPCEGSHLRSLPITIVSGEVFIDEAAAGSFYDG